MHKEGEKMEKKSVRIDVKREMKKNRRRRSKKTIR